MRGQVPGEADQAEFDAPRAEADSLQGEMGQEAWKMARDAYVPPFSHYVKANVAAAYFRKITLFYEYKWNSRWSFQMAAGYKVNGKLPQWAFLGEFVTTDGSKGIRGFSLAPEVRYYFWDRHCGKPLGLYVGGYAATTHYHGALRFNFWDGEEYIDVGGAGQVWEYGAGLQIGYSLDLGKRWNIDLMFAGPRLSREHVRMKLDSDFATVVIPRIEEELNKRLEALGHDPISIPVDAEFNLTLGISSFRYAVAVGYRF